MKSTGICGIGLLSIQWRFRPMGRRWQAPETISTVRVWDVETGQEKHTLVGTYPLEVVFGGVFARWIDAGKCRS